MSETISKIVFVGMLVGSVAFSNTYFADGRENGGNRNTRAVGVVLTTGDPVPEAPESPAPAPVLTETPVQNTTPQSVPVKTESVPATLPAHASGPILPFVRVGQGNPTIASQAVLVANLGTGEEYFASEPMRRWPIASLTKLMTAGVVTDTLDLDSITVPIGNGTYNGTDAFKMMLIASSNDAAEALASVSDRDAFIARMNARAAEWGMHDTHFTDPTGLSSTNQSTARDLLVLAQHIRRDYSAIFSTTRRDRTTVRNMTTKASETVRSTNLFAGKSEFVGGKTGYIEEAIGNLLSVFSRSGEQIFIVTLGTADRFGETERIYQWFTESYASPVRTAGNR